MCLDIYFVPWQVDFTNPIKYLLNLQVVGVVDRRKLREKKDISSPYS